jgi:hypothetical protein
MRRNQSVLACAAPVRAFHFHSYSEHTYYHRYLFYPLFYVYELDPLTCRHNLGETHRWTGLV